MKNLYLIFFLLIVVKVNAQNDSIAICETGYWISCDYVFDPVNIGVIEHYYLLYVDGTTEVNGRIYHKLMCKGLSNPYFSGYVDGEATFTYQISNGSAYVLGFRNDYSNRAYCIFNDTVPEILWYDFNVSPGDTLSMTNDHPYSYQPFQFEPYVVSNIDSVEYCGNNYAKYNFTLENMPPMIKQVGFMGNLIHGNQEFFEGGSRLICFCDHPLASEGSHIFVGVETLTLSHEYFSVYPNPTKGVVTIETNQPIHVFVTNVAGEKIKAFEIDHTSEINLSEFETGMYFFTEEETGKTIRIIKQ